jgi:hypothetical protein
MRAEGPERVEGLSAEGEVNWSSSRVVNWSATRAGAGSEETRAEGPEPVEGSGAEDGRLCAERRGPGAMKAEKKAINADEFRIAL